MALYNSMLPKPCKWCCFSLSHASIQFSYVDTSEQYLHLSTFLKLPGVPFTASPTHSLYLFVPGKTARNKYTLGTCTYILFLHASFEYTLVCKHIPFTNCQAALNF
jgi:hypothetical protein